MIVAKKNLPYLVNALMLSLLPKPATPALGANFSKIHAHHCIRREKNHQLTSNATVPASTTGSKCSANQDME